MHLYINVHLCIYLQTHISLEIYGIFFIYIFIEVELIYNAVPMSAVQESDSVTHI